MYVIWWVRDCSYNNNSYRGVYLPQLLSWWSRTTWSRLSVSVGTDPELLKIEIFQKILILSFKSREDERATRCQYLVVEVLLELGAAEIPHLLWDGCNGPPAIIFTEQHSTTEDSLSYAFEGLHAVGSHSLIWPGERRLTLPVRLLFFLYRVLACCVVCRSYPNSPYSSTPGPSTWFCWEWPWVCSEDVLETLILDRMFNRELRQLLLDRIKTEDLKELASVISFIQEQEIPSSGHRRSREYFEKF